MIGAGLAFSVMSAFVKAVSTRIPVFQVTFFRGAVSAVIILAVMLARGISLKGENQKILVVRALSGFTAMSLNFYALSKINLGDASLLHQTTPFFVIIFSALFLGETFYHRLLWMTLLCFIGIAVILRPTGDLFNYGGMAALASSLFAATAYVSIRHLHKTDSFWTMSFYFMATAALLSVPPMLKTWVTPTATEWLLLIGTGLTGTVGQLWVSYSYKDEDASFVAPFAYAGVLFSFLWGIVFFTEVPTLLTLIGATLTIAGAIGILMIKRTIEVEEN
jgi:drug/metabolite transporter (DMT)-like permease